MLTIDVLRDEAHAVRKLLSTHRQQGVQFTERRSWWFWVRFTVTGPPEALSRVASDLADQRNEKILEDAW